MFECVRLFSTRMLKNLTKESFFCEFPEKYFFQLLERHVPQHSFHVSSQTNVTKM